MTFLRNHWYDLGLIPMSLTALYLALNWGDLSVLSRLALLNFFVIWWHQFEEYRLPGGEAAITNLAMQPSDDGPSDRYPLNQNNAMVINVLASLIFYFLPVFFPNILWLSFAPVVFGLLQFVVHAIITPKKIDNRFYSPDLGAVILGHVPIACYWFYYTMTKGQLTLLDVVFGVVYLMPFVAGFMMKMGYGLLKSPTSPYPFPKAEFERGGYAERIRQLQEK